MGKFIRHFILGIFLCTSLTLNAQLPHGTVAPDWTVTDINGVTHNLYNILDAGTPVVLEFSATWCSPCWNYHNTHVMRDFYNDYGPSQVEMFYMEASPLTNEQCLYGPSGCVGGTQGDWVTGTPYNICHLTGSNQGLGSQYQIPGYPTFYAIAPDHRAYSQWPPPSYSQWEDWIIESFSLDATGNVVEDGCGLGDINLTTTGGFGNINYSWSNGSTSPNLTAVPSGNYSVTITDGKGYDIERDFTVTGPSNGPLQITLLSIVDVACFGDNTGSLEVDGLGGYGNYSFDWSNGATGPIADNLTFGSYDVSVTDNFGCLETQNFFIDEPDDINIFSNITDASCGLGTGAISMSVGGGVFPYTYDLGNGQSNQTGQFFDLFPGTYNASVSDGNLCIKYKTLVVDDDPAPTAMAITDGNMITCAAPQNTVSGMGSTTGTGITYQWTTTNGNIVSGATSIDAIVDRGGDYTLEVSNIVNGCSSMSSVTLGENTSTPMITVSDDADLTCAVTSLQLCATVDAGHTVEWLLPSGNVSGLCVTVNAADTYDAIVMAPNGCTNTGSVVVGISADLPQITINTPATLTCASPSTTLSSTVQGTLTDFTFLWTSTDGTIVSGADTPNPEVNAGGTYTLSVTNIATACESIQNVLVDSEANLPEASFEYELINGVLTLTNTSAITEGVTWNLGDGNTATDNQATVSYTSNGTYEVCVSVSNDCGPGQHCIQIPYAVALAVDNAKNNIICHGQSNGSATLNIAGGQDPYMVEWSGTGGFTSTEVSISNLGAGTYAYTVNDDFGYTQTGSIDIEEPAELLISLDGKTDVACFGDDSGSITLSANGGTGDLAYMWSNQMTTASLSNLAPGTYTLNVTDANLCVASQEVVIEGAAEIVIQDSQISNASSGADDGTIDLTVDGGTGDLQYLWNSGQTTARIENLAPGDYSCEITDANLCKKTSDTYTVARSVSVNEIDGLQSFDIFPNPAAATLNVNLEFDQKLDFNLNILSLDGKIVRQQRFSQNHLQTRLDVSDLQDGMYFIQLSNDSGVKTQKFIKLGK